MDREELLKKMGDIVEKDVTEHKNDFYKHDIENIGKYKGDMVWIVRESGTHLIPLDNSIGSTETLDAVISCYPDAKVYHIRENEFYYMREISKEEAKRMDDRKRKYKIRIDCGFMSAGILDGNFDNFEKANERAQELAKIYSDIYDTEFSAFVEEVQ